MTLSVNYTTISTWAKQNSLTIQCIVGPNNAYYLQAYDPKVNLELTSQIPTDGSAPTDLASFLANVPGGITQPVTYVTLA